MPNILQIPIPITNAAIAWPAGQSNVSSLLFINQDLNNTIWIGAASNITAGGSNTIPILPNGTFSGDASSPWYVIGSVAGTQPLVMVPNGQAYFLGLTQGLGKLAIPSMRSPNFITGVSGWQIAKDGSAEFNNLSIRGTFNGTNYIINANGAFFYSGTPAIGNLVASISNQNGGVDPPHNNILAGNTTYFFNGSVYIAQQCNGPSIIWWTAPTENGTWTQIGSVTGSPSQLSISGNAHANPVQIQGSLVSIDPYALLANQGSAPGGFSNFGTVYANANGVPAGVTDVGANGTFPLTKAVQGGNTNNTTSMNAMFTPFPITAFDSVNGTAYEIECGGHGTQAATTATTLNFQLFALGLAWGLSTDGGNVPAGASFHWHFHGTLIIGGNTNNSPGSFFGTMTISQALANAQGHSTAMDQQRANGVDPTAGGNVTLQAGWTSVVNTPTLVCTGATIKRIGS